MTVSPRPLQEIYWIPFVDSVKLFTHGSLFAAYYNVFGNIIWFMPIGLFSTGVTHIDDVICNVLGSVLGYWCYKKYKERKRRLEL